MGHYRISRRAFSALLLSLFFAATLTHAKPQANAQTLSTEQQQIIQRGQQLLSQQQATQAFAHFREHEATLAGSNQFDYWYGVAAVRAGEPFEASVALERVIANQPNHAGARLELVAVYIQLNQLNSAEQQLDVLDGLNPPTRARSAMNRFRDVIAERRSVNSHNMRFVTLSLDTGYDSNYLNYPDSFDLFADTILEGIAVLEADDTSYNNVRGVYWQRFDLKHGSYFEASLMGQMRVNHNSAASMFDTTVIHGAGVFGTELSDTRELRVGVEHAQLWLDNDRYRYHTGLTLGLREKLNGKNELHVNGAYRTFQFNQSRNDYYSWSGDLEWRHAWSAQTRLRFKAGFEQETVVEATTRQGGDLDKLHVSAHIDYNLSAQTQILATLGYEAQEYSSAAFAVFNRGVADIRDDDSLRARLEWAYQPTQHWRFSLFGQYREQTSSIDFFDLDQTLVQGSVTYVF
ncbi:tetratricopeptide repeat protein [Aliidiomarina celeris]|uniref:tetratricopeptide repeat protein n=1 Tax=Aliidiomarina celeris TaxID=2249428 RepID=UPI0013002456|nr:tetratricopeptide repeat protein [Aliidiomarina celeris]